MTSIEIIFYILGFENKNYVWHNIDNIFSWRGIVNGHTESPKIEKTTLLRKVVYKSFLLQSHLFITFHMNES